MCRRCPAARGTGGRAEPSPKRTEPSRAELRGAETAAPACPGRPLLPASSGAPQARHDPPGAPEGSPCAERPTARAWSVWDFGPGPAQPRSPGRLPVADPRLSERWREGCVKAIIKRWFNQDHQNLQSSYTGEDTAREQWRVAG